MYLTLRLDDITPCMDMGKFTQFCDMMDRHGIRPLLGVVPDPKDPSLDYTAGNATDPAQRTEDFYRMLKDLQAKGYSIAMHGLTHVYETKEGGLFPLNKQSEFAGRPYEEQADMIRKGREILLSHGIETDVFMAPSHTFDRNTIRALLDNGFTAMTDGFGTRPYRYLGMKFYPISFLRKRTLRRAEVSCHPERSEGSSLSPEDNTGDGSAVSGFSDNTGDGSAVSGFIDTENRSSVLSVTLVVHTNTLTATDLKAYERIFATYAFLPYDSLFTQEAAELSSATHVKHYLMATAKRVLR